MREEVEERERRRGGGRERDREAGQRGGERDRVCPSTR